MEFVRPPELRAVIGTDPDVPLLFATRLVRLFAYGFVSVILVLYLAQVGLRDEEIGLLLSGTLAGDAAVSFWITTTADRVGRRRMLILGAGLMVFAGIVFALSESFVALLVAAIIGVISPTGNEIGPFLSIEQSSVSQLIPESRRVRVFAWYNLAGSVATASGALIGGLVAEELQRHGLSPLESYRVVLTGYIACGIILIILFLKLSPGIETPQRVSAVPRRFGLHASRGVVLRLSSLFALDAFAGGFIVQSIIAYWFHLRFGVNEGTLGAIFFGANILAGISALLAARIAQRIGLLNTMVFTHLPSSVLLCLVPCMPTLQLTVAVLLMRFSISQMDVPTRQAYTMAAVSPDERSAASGITGIARSIGATGSPVLSGIFIATPMLMNAPFFVAGGLKVIYDLLLFRAFKSFAPAKDESELTTKGRSVDGQNP